MGRPLRKLSRVDFAQPVLLDTRKPLSGFRPLPLNKRTMFDNDQFQFLNELGQLTDWNDPSKSKLWLYNLHYFDDLNSSDAADRYDLHEALIDRWIDQNPLGVGNGWEPYPTSLRIVNWIKWLLATDRVSAKRVSSLALQAKVLSQTLETHLLGNHLFANAKALLFAGLYFSGKEADRWLKNALKIFDKELPEQILSDGGNFELSPMYHATITTDVLDMVSIMSAYEDPRCASVLSDCKAVLPRMLHWLEVMTHPDGDVSFFNDAAIGIAPSFTNLLSTAASCGINLPPLEPRRLRHLPNSGYFRLDLQDGVLIGDVGKVGPDFIPGHAHADTLSFELSIFGSRLLVNSGTSVYGISPERDRQRGTAAHNTVLIDGENSSEVWSGFRVARRARPFDLNVDPKGNWLKCSHDGYRRLKGKPIHTRKWSAAERALVIEDQVVDDYKSAKARFHIHPNWQVRLKGREVICESEYGVVTMSVTIGIPNIETSTYHPRFGVTLENKVLSVDLESGMAKLEVSW